MVEFVSRNPPLLEQTPVDRCLISIVILKRSIKDFSMTHVNLKSKYHPKNHSNYQKKSSLIHLAHFCNIPTLFICIVHYHIVTYIF